MIDKCHLSTNLLSCLLRFTDASINLPELLETGPRGRGGLQLEKTNRIIK